MERLEEERDEARADYDQALRRAEQAEERVLALEKENRRVGAALQAAERHTANATTQRADFQSTLNRIAGFVAQELEPYSAEPLVSTIQSARPAGDDFAAAATEKTGAARDISADKPEDDEDEPSSHSEVDELESPSASGRKRKRTASSGRQAIDLPPKRQRRARQVGGLSRPATTSSTSLGGRGKTIAGQKQKGRVSSPSDGNVCSPLWF